MGRNYLYLPALALIGIAGAFVAINGCNNGGGGGTSAEGAKRISGAGATFPEGIISQWKQDYKTAKGVEIEYEAKGSGLGIQQMSAQTVQFGCSDAPMKKEQLAAAKEKGGEVIHIPITMGPIVPVYNLPGLSAPLTLNGKVLADIYMGKIKKWNDPAIKELNKDANLPDMEIVPVYRAEASGTTFNFKEYLAKNSPAFKSSIGVSTEPTWSKGVGIGERNNAGVAKRVKESPGAIGYVELHFAKQAELAFAAVVNKSGKAVLGTAEGCTAAAGAAMDKPQTEEPYKLHELTFNLIDPDGENSYPITAISYCIFYKKQPASTGKALAAFLRWATTDGQKSAVGLDYAPLPAELVKKIDARLNQVEFAP
jgi:phosphate transport system substrate-binding protein